MRTLFGMVAVGLVFGRAVAAQTSPDTAATLIRAGRLFDSEAGTFSGRRDILVKRGRIEKVGENLEVPAGCRVIDLRQYTVLPGLIDAHTHLLYLEGVSGGITMEGVKALVSEGLPLRAPRCRAGSDLPPGRHHHRARPR